MLVSESFFDVNLSLKLPYTVFILLGWCERTPFSVRQNQATYIFNIMRALLPFDEANAAKQLKVSLLMLVLSIIFRIN